MKWIANIKKIGKKAVDNKDGMVILFGEGANKDLEDVSVIQKFSTETPVSGFVFKKGDTITVDGQTYVANYVGPMVESNMKALGHATLFFNRPFLRRHLLMRSTLIRILINHYLILRLMMILFMNTFKN